MTRLSTVFLLISLLFGLTINGNAENLPSRILSASEDSLILTIEQSKHLIETNVIPINPEEIASCGLSCYQRGQLKYARDFFSMAKDKHFAENDSAAAARMTSNIAVVYELEGDYELAIKTHYQALEIFTSTNDQEAIAKCMNNLGVVFQEMNDTKNARKYHTEALMLKKALNDSSGIASSLNNLGVLWEENLMNSDSSLHYYQRSLDIYRQINDEGNQARLLSNIAAIYVDKGNYTKALAYLKEGETKAIETNEKITLNNIQKNSAYAHLESGNLKTAEEIIAKGLQMSIDVDYLKNQIEFLSLKAELEEKQGKYEMCVSTQKEFQHLKDSLINKEKNEAISKQEVLFDTKRKEHLIEIAEQALMFSKFELQRQKDILLLSIIGTFLIGIVILLLVLRSRQRNKIQRISLENKMLRSQMNPHFMFNALGAIQNFMLENNSEDSMVYLLDFSRLMRNILDSSRTEEISIQKEIQIVEDYLDLQKLRLENKFNYSIQIDKTLNTEDTFIPPMLLQPFLENAIEHGIRKLPVEKEGRINLKIHKNHNTITLKVSDNGPGFVNENNTNKNHISHAMNITQERIKAINQLKKFKISLNIQEKTEKGIEIEFKIEAIG